MDDRTLQEQWAHFFESGDELTLLRLIVIELDEQKSDAREGREIQRRSLTMIYSTFVSFVLLIIGIIIDIILRVRGA